MNYNYCPKFLFILLIGIAYSSLFGQTLNVENPSISNTINWKVFCFKNIENSTYIDSWQTAMSLNGVNICYSYYSDIPKEFLPDDILPIKIENTNNYKAYVGLDYATVYNNMNSNKKQTVENWVAIF